MNRLTKAWLALTGRLEPEVREIVREVLVVDAVETKLYVVNVPDKTGDSIRTFAGGAIWQKSNPVYFTSCAQAHADHPDEYVKEVKAIRAGGNYFVGNLKRVDIQPKPKRPKGKVR